MLVLAQRQQNWLGGVLAHFGHPLRTAGTFGQTPYIGRLGILLHLCMHHAAAAAHVGQRSPKPLAHQALIDPLHAKALAQHRQKVIHHLAQTRQRHRHRHLANAL